jgi:hypothetical protein
LVTATTNPEARRKGTIVFLLLAGLLMAALALPRLMAELTLVPGTPSMTALYAGEALGEEELSLIDTTRSDSLALADHASAAYELAALYDYRARQTSTAEDRAAFIDKSITASRLAIERSPANTFYWLQLAHGLSRKGTDHELEAIAAWEMSLKTAWFEPALLLPRIHLGMVLLPAMTDQQTNTLRDQIDLTYRWHRGMLRQYARQNGLLPSLEYLLGDTSEIVAFIKP